MYFDLVFNIFSNFRISDIFTTTEFESHFVLPYHEIQIKGPSSEK
jgi:hypothetical protein